MKSIQELEKLAGIESIDTLEEGSIYYTASLVDNVYEDLAGCRTTIDRTIDGIETNLNNPADMANELAALAAIDANINKLQQQCKKIIKSIEKREREYSKRNRSTMK